MDTALLHSSFRLRHSTRVRLLNSNLQLTVKVTLQLVETVLQLEATIKRRCISKTHQPPAAERLHALLAGCPAETLSWIEQLRVVRVKQTRKRCKRSSAWIPVSHVTGACQNSSFERVRSCPVHASRLMQRAGTQQLSERHW